MKLLEAIEKIPDPRMEGKVKHKLSSIIFMTLCAVLSGCECWNDIEDYCKTKKRVVIKTCKFKIRNTVRMDIQAIIYNTRSKNYRILIKE